MWKCLGLCQSAIPIKIVQCRPSECNEKLKIFFCVVKIQNSASRKYFKSFNMQQEKKNTFRSQTALAYFDWLRILTHNEFIVQMANDTDRALARILKLPVSFERVPV